MDSQTNTAGSRSGASLRGRHARRLRREQPRERLRWSVLLAGWAHLGAVAILAVLPAPPRPHVASPVAVPVDLVIRLPAASERDAVASAPSSPEGTAVAVRSTRDVSPRPLTAPDDGWERFVRTDTLLAARDAPDAPVAISSKHTTATHNLRAPVTADQAGPSTAPTEGHDLLPSNPTLEERDRARFAGSPARSSPAAPPRGSGADGDGDSPGAGGRSVAREPIGTLQAPLDPAADADADQAPGAAGAEADRAHRGARFEDPVLAVREALGWGELDRARLAPRPAFAGAVDGLGAAHTSPLSALDTVPISWRTSLDTLGTPLGAYIERIEDIVVGRWRDRDLDPHARAIGIQGQVTVRYLVESSGRVRDVRITRSSGNVELDAMALASIPSRLPRIPSKVGRDELHHQLVLRYRNPLVASGDAG